MNNMDVFRGEKIKVKDLDIIVTGTANKPYFEIKYVLLDGTTHIGYSSYNLNNVFDWKENCFDVCKGE